MKNPPFIVSLFILVLGCTLLRAAEATVVPSPPPAPVPAISPVQAELESTKAQLQQTQQANQYLQVLAERNELGIRVLTMTQQVTQLNAQLVAEQAKIADLQKQLDELKTKPPAKK